MEIVRAATRAASAGPADWFTGEVSIAPVGAGAVPAARVTFQPGARTAWHTHPLGQTIHVESGVCLVGRDDGTVERLEAGDAAWFEPGENHWHGASADGPMTHTAIQRADESGSPVEWGRHVSDEEYGA
jgi:quercetin dioxygenase-like cupin family protein